MVVSFYFVEEDLKFLINFMLNVVYELWVCICEMLVIVDCLNFLLQNIIFEFMEDEKMDIEYVFCILVIYCEIGFGIVIDDFGVGYVGLLLLVKFCLDIVKFDMELICNIDIDVMKCIIVKYMLCMLEELEIMLFCEGVEILVELVVFQDFGVWFMQGYVLV